MMTLGVPKDEYVESNHVTPQIYVRVGRRLLGDYFLTQHDLVEDRFKTDVVCMGNYGFDSHKIQSVRTAEGLKAEGQISGSTDLYDIPYRCLTYSAIPNMIDVVTISASSVAYSSLRMEPVYMMLGQAGGIAAHLANAGNVAVTAIPISALQDRAEEIRRSAGGHLPARGGDPGRDAAALRPGPTDQVQARAQAGDRAIEIDRLEFRRHGRRPSHDRRSDVYLSARAARPR